MSYILSILPVIPIAILVSGIIYAIIYNVMKKKREKPNKVMMLMEFVLIGWSVMFIYVTQIMNFGNGMGARFNLKPLQMFYIAFRYGSNNAGGLEQFLLNILMFVPLSLLFPIVFKKFRNWKSILIVSLSCTIMTELVQLITYRGTDIDDIIANTLGGLCGFAVYLIVYGIVSGIRHKSVEVSKYTKKLLIGIILLSFITATFVGLKFCDGSSKYGSLYYGHLVPTGVEVMVELDDTNMERPVYRYVEQISLQELEAQLQSVLKFAGEWKKEHNTGGDYYLLSASEIQVAFIHQYNTWSVYYEYASDNNIEVSQPIDEETAFDKAWGYLAYYGITPTEISYDENNNIEYADNDYHFHYVPINDNDDMYIYGTVSLTIGRDGRLIEISDDRIWCEYIENAECISATESIKIAQEVGVGNWQEKAVVQGIEDSYSFIKETGYLIPIWKIKGYLNADGGQTLEWTPEIDAVK